MCFQWDERSLKFAEFVVMIKSVIVYIMAVNRFVVPLINILFIKTGRECVQRE